MPRLRMPSLPPLSKIIDSVARYRTLAIEGMYDVMPEFEDPTLDYPRIGYTHQYPSGSGPIWRVVHRGIPWDHTIHSLRHVRDLAEAGDGYAYIEMPYTLASLTREASYKGTIPPETCEGFTLAVWPVFAVRYKSDKWLRLDAPERGGLTMPQLFEETPGCFLHTSREPRREPIASETP